TGRYTQAAKGKLIIHGTRAGGPFTREVQVDFPAENSGHAALEKIWARNKVDNLMSQDWMGIQQGQSKHKAEIVEVGLKHTLPTQYTSFGAVETKTVIQDGKPVRIEVPVELPENVSPLAVPSAEADQSVAGFWSRGSASGGFAHRAPSKTARLMAPPSPPPAGTVDMTTVEVTAAPSGVETQSPQQTTKLGTNWIVGPNSPAGGDDKTLKADKPKQKDDLLASKLSADLLTLYQCSQKRTTTANGQACNLPKSGKVFVEVKLDSGSAAIDHKLTDAGLTIKSGAGTALVTGEISISKLKALVEISEVKSVTKLEQETRHIRPRG